MHTNGLSRANATLGGMSSLESQAAFRRHAERTDARLKAGEPAAHPSQMGYGMVLEARGNVYPGSVPPATVAKRRAKNKAARRARAKARR